MTDFLLELRSEEIPARMQAKAREDLARLFTAELAAAGLPAPEIATYSTPRRLALIARDLPLETAAVSEEIKGPKASAPPQALEGFLRKTGLTREQLVERDGVLFAVIDKPGRATADVLAAAIPRIVFSFPWPKSMRWGAGSASMEALRWVRPLQGVVALLGEQLVEFNLDHVNVTEMRAGTVLGENVYTGIRSGRETMGHRFHSSGAISITSAATYADQLRDAHVIVDHEERAQIIALGATMAARKAGLELIKDEGLLIENAGLTEWPVPLLGRFDEAFLAVPPEVIQLTARVNQKYFVCADADGKLANAFVCTANIDAADGGAGIIEGNRKVLAARLSDAKFFYDTDLKVPLEEQAKKLDRIVFHEKLGTVADKVERVAKLARWLVEEGIVNGRAPAKAGAQGDDAPGGPGLLLSQEHLADLAERAARLCKADLVTGMVGEFPELQGLMGGYYAAAQGEDRRVAAAIRDHYKPVGQGDEVPTDPVTVAVSLADKLDSFVSFFRVKEFPTGSRDPFALRRSVLGIVAILEEMGLRLRLQDAVNRLVAYHRPRAFRAAISGLPILDYLQVPDDLQSVTLRSERKSDGSLNCFLKLNDTEHGPFADQSFEGLMDAMSVWHATGDLDNRILDFATDRLKVQQREAGVRHDLIDAVFALGGEDDLVRLLARVHALQAFIGTADGANLLAGYKRAANILKKEGYENPAQNERHPGLDPGSRLSTAEEEAGPRLGGRGDGGGGAGGLPYTPEPAEAALIAALDLAEPAAATAVAAEDFEGAMAALATLRAPIDAFFEGVIVNDPDPDTRAARLALLARVRDAVHSVADFSRIEG